MDRHEAIGNAYHRLGKDATFYDGMVTCSTLLGRAVCHIVWNMGKKESQRYLELALSGIPADFKGSLLEVPVGTGVLTMPVYQTMPQASITCLDYSPDMMNKASRRAETLGLRHVSFCQGDVGDLPFADGSFDTVLSLNGFHAFPDKDAAFAETFRVLRPGGVFCGCFYIKGQNKRTDWFMRRIYTPLGYFTPPFETVDSLKERLATQYAWVDVQTVESMACFVCRKGRG